MCAETIVKNSKQGVRMIDEVGHGKKKYGRLLMHEFWLFLECRFHSASQCVRLI